MASNKSDTFSECAFTFFSNTVKAYGAATPLVPALANLTLKTLAASDECEKQFEAKVRVRVCACVCVCVCVCGSCYGQQEVCCM